MSSVTNPANRVSIFRLSVAYLLFGFMTGIIWMAALMPVHVTGAIGYDLSRYGFALSALIALLGLFSSAWRAFGLPVAVAGVALGIVSWAVFRPLNLSPRGELFFLMIIFCAPLSIAAAASVCFAVARQVSERKSNFRGNGNEPSAAPRRFGVRTLMFAIVIASLFLAVANWVSMPPAASLTIGSFLGGIGGLQCTEATYTRLKPLWVVHLHAEKRLVDEPT